MRIKHNQLRKRRRLSTGEKLVWQRLSDTPPSDALIALLRERLIKPAPKLRVIRY